MRENRTEPVKQRYLKSINWKLYKEKLLRRAKKLNEYCLDNIDDIELTNSAITNAIHEAYNDSCKKNADKQQSRVEFKPLSK